MAGAVGDVGQGQPGVYEAERLGWWQVGWDVVGQHLHHLPGDVTGPGRVDVGGGHGTCGGDAFGRPEGDFEREWVSGGVFRAGRMSTPSEGRSDASYAYGLSSLLALVATTQEKRP
ncbi:hypothetical protein ACIO1C_26710 [Streptomyces sp. NPDC087420]|uniref:hypothetical protein n=1 Tax=Streptomyces sp. NPDC087420 TaxID=3365785 RepID=UPI00383301C9